MATSAQQFLDRAYDAESQGKLDEALVYCDKAIAANINLADAYNLRGIILEQLNRPEDATAAYREALIADPDDSEAEQNLKDLNDELTLPHRARFDVSILTGLSCALAFALIFALSSIPAMLGQIYYTRPNPSGAVANNFVIGLLSALGGLLMGAFAGIAVSYFNKPALHRWRSYALVGAFAVFVGSQLFWLLPIRNVLAWVVQNPVGITNLFLWANFALLAVSIAIAVGIVSRLSVLKISVLCVGGAIAAAIAHAGQLYLVDSLMIALLGNKVDLLFSGPPFYVYVTLRNLILGFLIGLFIGGIHQWFHYRPLPDLAD